MESYRRPPLCWSLGQLALYDLAAAPCLADMTLPLAVTVCDCDPIEFELESGLVKVGGNVAAQDGRSLRDSLEQGHLMVWKKYSGT